MANPGFTFGQVPTAAQWNAAFDAAQPLLGFTPVNRAGDTMTGKLNTPASALGSSGFALAPGVAPSAPVNGDLWLTGSGIFARIGGLTVQLATGGTVNSGTANQLAYYSATAAAVSGNANFTVFNSTLTLGVAGSAAGALVLSGATSGGVTLAGAAVGSNGMITFPAGTVDFSATGGTSRVVKQTSAGGIFTVAQLAVTDLSTGTVGSGSIVLATSPTLTTPTLTTPTMTAPVLGVASATSLAISNGTSNLTFTAAAGTNASMGIGGGGTFLLSLGSTNDTFNINDSSANTLFSMGEGTPGTASTNQTTFIGSMVIGVPTGGQKGAGTLNVATNIFLNNTAYTNPDFVFEHAYTGQIVRFANNPGARDYVSLMPLRELRQYTRDNLRLPGIDDAPAGVVERFDTVLAKLEEMTLYVLDLNEQMEKLKVDNESLRCEIQSLRGQ